MAFNIEYIYTVADRFSRPLKKFDKLVDRASRSTANASKRVRALGMRAEKAADKFNQLGGAIGSAAIIGGMAMAVKQSVAVEDALADLVRVGDLTETQLSAMDMAMESLSQEIGKSKIGLLQQGFEGLKMGIPIDELEHFVRLAARTGIAFDIGDQAAGSALGSIRAKLGMTTDTLGDLMDSVNFVADNFAANGERMVNIIARTSGSMKTLQFPPQVVAGLAGFADQIEVTSELAASGLRQMFAKMQQNPKLVKKLMSDPVAALREQFQKFAKIDPAKRFSAIEKRFGLEAARFMSKATSSIELFDETMKAAASERAFGSMMREMANRAERTSTLFSIMGAVFGNTMEAVGEALKPAVKAMTNFAIKASDAFKVFAQNNPTLIQFAGIFATIVAIAGVAGIALMGFSIAIGLLTGPIFLIAAGIGLAVAALVRWVDTNNPLIISLGKIYNSLAAALTPLGELFGLVGGGVSFLDSMIAAIDGIGMVIAIVLTPIEMMARSLQGLIETVIALKNLDFGGAMDAISSTFSDQGSILSSKASDISSFAAGGKAGNNSDVNMSGTINVEASGGATVKSANIGLPQGNNLATIQ